MNRKSHDEAVEGYRNSVSVEVMDSVRKTFGASPAYSVSWLECELAHRDAGLFAAAYQNVCKVMTTDVYSAYDVVGSQIIEELKEDAAGRCNYEYDSTTPQDNRWQRTTLTYVPEVSDDFMCHYRGAPSVPSYNEDVVVQQVISQNGTPLREQFFAVEFEEVVSHTELGCKPFGMIFCSSPIDKPVMPDLADI